MGKPLPRPTPAVPPGGSSCPGAGAPSPGCRHGPSGSGTGRSYIGPAGPLPPPLDSPPPRSLALETQKTTVTKHKKYPISEDKN